MSFYIKKAFNETIKLVHTNPSRKELDDLINDYMYLTDSIEELGIQFRAVEFIYNLISYYIRNNSLEDVYRSISLIEVPFSINNVESYSILKTVLHISDFGIPFITTKFKQLFRTEFFKFYIPLYTALYVAVIVGINPSRDFINGKPYYYYIIDLFEDKENVNIEEAFNIIMNQPEISKLEDRQCIITRIKSFLSKIDKRVMIGG